MRFEPAGNVSGIRNANASASSHRPTMTAAARTPSLATSEDFRAPRLAMMETVT